MNVAAIMAAMSAIRKGIELYAILQPQIKEWLSRNDISVEDQAALRAENEAIAQLFRDPENTPEAWKIRPDPETPSDTQPELKLDV